MNHELTGILQAAMEVDTPEWLDRVVTDRVVSVVEAETAASRPSQVQSEGARARSKPAVRRASPAVAPRMRALAARVGRAFSESRAELRTVLRTVFRVWRSAFERAAR